MCAHIIAAFRSQKQLRPAVRYTLQEIGHRMNAQGHGHISLTMLAYTTGWSRSTVQAHIAEAIEAKVLRKQCFKRGAHWGINLYTCRVPFRQPSRTARTGSIPAPGSTLPRAKTDLEKSRSLRDEIAGQRKALRLLPYGGGLWERTQEEIARLEALLRC